MKFGEKLAVIATVLAAAGPATAAYNVDAAEIEKDMLAAAKHLDDAKAVQGSNPTLALTHQIWFVHAVGDILIKHFGMDETEVNAQKRVVIDMVIGGTIDFLGIDW